MLARAHTRCGTCCTTVRTCSDTIPPTRTVVLRYIPSPHYPWHCTTRAVLRTLRVAEHVIPWFHPEDGGIRGIRCSAAPPHRYTHAVWHARYVRVYGIRQSCRYTWYSVPLVCSGTMLYYTTCGVQRCSPPLSSSTTYYLLCTHHPPLEPSCGVVLQRVAHIGLPVPRPHRTPSRWVRYHIRLARYRTVRLYATLCC